MRCLPRVFRPVVLLPSPASPSFTLPFRIEMLIRKVWPELEEYTSPLTMLDGFGYTYVNQVVWMYGYGGRKFCAF